MLLCVSSPFRWSLHGPFCMAAGTPTVAAIPLCRESEFTRYSLVCCSYCKGFAHNIKKKLCKSLMLLQHVLAHFTVSYLGSVILKPCS